MADPAFDPLPALLALDAELELHRSSEKRRVPVVEFLRGAGETTLGEGELIAAVVLPASSPGSVAHYERIARTRGDSPIASVAVVLTREADRVRSLRVAVGGCAPVPVHAPELDPVFADSARDPKQLVEVADTLAARCQPADDLRASAAYRHMVLPRLIRRAVTRALDRSAA